MKGLTGAVEPVDEEAPADDDSGVAEGIEVCCFDNRGMGRSSVPEKKSHYTCVHRVCHFASFYSPPLVLVRLRDGDVDSCWLTVSKDIVLAQFFASQDCDHVEGRARAHGSPGMAEGACRRPLHG